MNNTIDKALDRFQATRQGARRFHGEEIGNVDPENCFGSWLLAVKKAVKDKDEGPLSKYYRGGIQKASLAESSAVLGGYTVPVQFSDEIVRDISNGSLFRQHGGTVVEMTSAELDLFLPDVQTAQAAGTAPYFGGIVVSPIAENTTLPETAEPKFRQIKLRSWLFSGYALVSNLLMQDAMGIDTWLRKLFGWSLAWYESWFCFQGSGVGQHQGVINAAGAATRTRSGGANTIVAADVETMASKLLPSSWDRAVWFAHPTAIVQLTSLTGWIPNGPLMLYGRPIIPTGQCSTLGSRGDLVLADPALYVLGSRDEVIIAYSREEPTAWTKNQSVWRVGFRGDGQCWTAAPITLPDATSTVSPFVVLV